MLDTEVESLVRDGEIERAAALAQSRGAWRRAAELLASLGRSAEAALAAVRASEWRLAVEIALTSGDEQVIAALAEEAGHDATRAVALAAQCRLMRRDDVAAMILEETAPAESAQAWYACAHYDRAARAWDRANDATHARRAFEQHLAQNPDDVSSAMRLSELRAVIGDNAGAVRALQVAVRAGGAEPAMERLVCGLARLGYEHAARDWVRRLRDLDASHAAELSAYDDKLPRNTGGEKRYAGRYRVLREVGSGATGRVLEAVDELSGDTVALKVLAVSDDRSAAFARFMREAELARLLDDPNLVRMRALDPEGPTIVYDWMPGGTLAERIGTMRLVEVRVVMLRVLAALETLHRNGVVHRDVKPNNILFDPAGQARLGDLGAAHLGDLGATVTGGLVGSLPYMAPEQITGGAVSASTDFYALGCVFFQMLTGLLPFAGPDFVSQHLGEAPPRVSELRPGLAPAFEGVIEAMLAKNPDDRLPDAASVRARLATLTWEEPESPGAAVPRRVPSFSSGAAEEGARFVPSATCAGAWTDLRLARDVVRVYVPDAERALVHRWATVNHTALQPVYDVLEEGAHVEVHIEPLTANATLATVSDEARARVRDALEAAGADLRDTDTLRVAWNAPEAVALLAEVLRARGVSLDGAEP